MKLFKRYIDVIVRQKRSGKSEPLYICWDNGKMYKIDKILDCQRRASQVGGCGLRYSCMIQGEHRYLFFEKDRWFIESHQP